MERKELKNSNTWSRVSNSVSSVRLISLSRYIFSKMLKQESCWHRSSLYRVASILMIIQNLVLLSKGRVFFQSKSFKTTLVKPFKHLLLGCPAAASIVQMVAFFKAVSRSESWMAVL